MLDCNSTMGKLFASGKSGSANGADSEMKDVQNAGVNALNQEPQTRFDLGIESVKMLLEQKVSEQVAAQPRIKFTVNTLFFAWLRCSTLPDTTSAWSSLVRLTHQMH